MARAELVNALRAHALELAPNMRVEDAAEVRASSRMTPVRALLHALEHSELAIALLVDGQVAAIGGVAPMSPALTLVGRPYLGNAWMLTGHLVPQHPKAFLRACRYAVQVFLERYPILGNLVDARYETALRWAGWLGFEVYSPVLVGPEQLPFHPIRMRRSSWAAS